MCNEVLCVVFVCDVTVLMINTVWCGVFVCDVLMVSAVWCVCV